MVNSESTSRRLIGIWVALIARLVPRSARARWLEEWRGELAYGIGPAGSHGTLRGLATGALRDAVALRFPGRDRVGAGDGLLAGGGLLLALRLSVRSLRATPGPTIAAVTALTLGIGAAVSVFAVVNAVLLRPLPYLHSERLVNIWQIQRGPLGESETTLSEPHARALLERAGVFEQVALSQAGEWVLSQQGSPRSINYLRVRSSFLPLLGVRPELGRLFVAQDDREGAPVQAILTYALWRDEFGGDPDILGKTVSINYVGEAPVVGVLPRGFAVDYETLGHGAALRGETVHAFFSLPANRFSTTPRAWNGAVLNAVGLLREGVSLAHAQAAVDELEPELTAARTAALGDLGPVRTKLVAVLDQAVRQARPSLLLVMAAIVLLLLLACANFANLLLGRGSLRGKEVAVHAALGAGRGHLLARFLSEALLVSLAGAALGLALSELTLRGVALYGDRLQLPRLREIAIDGDVLAVAAGLVLFTALASGLIPALRLSRVNLEAALKDTGDRPMGGGLRGRLDLSSGLVAVEVALSVALLIGTLLLVRSLVALNRVELGFDRLQTLSFKMFIPRDPYRLGAPFREYAALLQTLRERLGSIPGVQGVAASSDVPFDQRGSRQGVVLAQLDDEPVVEAEIVYADPEFRRVMGMRLLAGRDFVRADFTEGSAFVAIVDEGLARRYGNEQEALGKVIRPQGWEESLEIVGVIAAVRDSDLGLAPGMQVYMGAAFSTPAPFHYVALRTDTAPAGAIDRVRQEVRDIDPDILVTDLLTTEQRLGSTIAMRRVSTLLLQVLVAIGAVLALTGVYAVVTDRVNQARHEIGVRMAVGASAVEVRRRVLGYTALLATAGAMAGAVLAAGLSRLLAGVLYGVAPLDVPTYLSAVLLLVVTAVAAAWVPARAASRVDPVDTLRHI